MFAMMLYQCNYDKIRLNRSLSIAYDSLHHVDIMSKGKKHLTSSETQNQNHSLTYTRAHTNGTKIHGVLSV